MGWREEESEKKRLAAAQASVAPWFVGRIALLTTELGEEPATASPEIASFLRETISKALRFHTRITTPTSSQGTFRDDD